MCSTWWPAVFSVIVSARAISFVGPALREEAQDLDLALAEPGRPGLADRSAAPRPPPPARRRSCACRARRRGPSRRARRVRRSAVERGAVGAVVRHRVIGVGSGQQPRPDVELRRRRLRGGSREPSSRSWCEPASRASGASDRGALEHALGVVRVQPDPLALARVQRARLVPDPVGHGDPADVVEEARGAHLRDLGARAAERLGGGRRELGDPGRVPVQEVDLDVGELAERARDRSRAPRSRSSPPAAARRR